MSSTIEKRFVDTNILFYAFSKLRDAKALNAWKILRNSRPGSLVISTQVLMEFINIAINKAAMPVDKVKQILSLRRYLEVVVIDPDDIELALDIRLESSISHWDSLIIAAAIKSDCKIIYTEDLNHGQVIRGVKNSQSISN